MGGTLHIGKVRVRSWVASSLWIVLIFTISSIPASAVKAMYTQLKSPILRFLFSDPVTHVIMLGMLAFLLGHSLRRNFHLMDKKSLILWTLLATLLVTVGIEIYQQLVIPGRAFEIRDLIWDFVGIGIAISYLFISFPKTIGKPPSIP